MSERQRIGSCLYVTAAGTYQTWHRDEDDKQRWRTFTTIPAAIRARDSERAKRATYTRTFQRTALGRLAKALTPPPPTKAEELERLLHQGQQPQYDADQGLVQVHNLGDR